MKESQWTMERIEKFIGLTWAKCLLSYEVVEGSNIDFAIDLAIRMLEEGIESPAVLELASYAGVKRKSFFEVRGSVRNLVAELGLSVIEDEVLIRLFLLCKIEMLLNGSIGKREFLQSLGDLSDDKRWEDSAVVVKASALYHSTLSDDPNVAQSAWDSLDKWIVFVIDGWRIQIVRSRTSDSVNISVEDAG